MYNQLTHCFSSNQEGNDSAANYAWKTEDWVRRYVSNVKTSVKREHTDDIDSHGSFSVLFLSSLSLRKALCNLVDHSSFCVFVGRKWQSRKVLCLETGYRLCLVIYCANVMLYLRCNIEYITQAIKKTCVFVCVYAIV